MRTACFLAPLLGLSISAATAAERLALDDAAVRALLAHRVDVERRAPGIAVAIVDARGARLIVHGTASGTRAVNADTRFEIGSITKPLTATALAVLAADGRLRLDDPLRRWVAEIPAGAPLGEVTLAQLATHTAGLPRLPSSARFIGRMLFARSDPYAHYTREDLLQDLAAITPETPGRFAYSNLGFALLGLALDRASGQPVGALIEATVLRPAGMRDARFAVAADDPALAAGHDAAGRGTPAWHLGEFAAAGGIKASAADMLALTQALLRGDPPFDAAHFEARAARDGARPAAERSVALGWMRQRENAEAPLLIWHNGGTGGFRSFIGIQPERGIGVAVLANSADDVDDLARHLLDPAQPLAAAPRASAIDWIALGVALVASLSLLRGSLGTLSAHWPAAPRWLLPAPPASRAQAAFHWLRAAAALAIAAALTSLPLHWHAALGLSPWWLLFALFAACTLLAWHRCWRPLPALSPRLWRDAAGAGLAVLLAALMWR
jgi:CubicO group peptidase (beta-lactamase class C family)